MTTEGAIIGLWSVTLVIALAITLAIVAMIVRIIHSSREINRLLKQTVPPAVGIVHNTAAIRELEAIVAAAEPLLAGTAAIKAATTGIRAQTLRLGRLLRVEG